MLHLFEHNWNLVWKSEANTTAFIDTVYERASSNTQAGGYPWLHQEACAPSGFEPCADTITRDLAKIYFFPISSLLK